MRRPCGRHRQQAGSYNEGVGQEVR